MREGKDSTEIPPSPKLVEGFFREIALANLVNFQHLHEKPCIFSGDML